MDSEPIRLFVGYDPREAIGTPVFEHSVHARASVPVSITRLGANVCGTDGTNAFSLARFHIPRLCGYEGWALWMDGADMLMLDDIAELWALRDEKYAVQVVKHDYVPRAPRKYIGTAMEAKNEPYPRKNWSSVVLWHCEHPANDGSVPADGIGAGLAEIEFQGGANLHRFSWLPDDDLIGCLPPEWNWLADEDGQCHPAKAKVVHWTNGGPWFPAYGDAPFAQLWRGEYRAMLGAA